MISLPNWLYDNTWAVPVAIFGGGILTALGTWLTYRNRDSALGAWLLIGSALLQAVTGCIWYGQPARFGH